MYLLNIRRLLRHEIHTKDFICKLCALGYSDEEIDVSLVACKHYAYPDIRHACKLFYEKLKMNRELSPIGFEADHMLKCLHRLRLPQRLTARDVLQDGIYAKI